jgi:hypothetical protein
LRNINLGGAFDDTSPQRGVEVSAFSSVWVVPG